jgi:hypothetical protein
MHDGIGDRGGTADWKAGNVIQGVRGNGVVSIDGPADRACLTAARIESGLVRPHSKVPAVLPSVLKKNKATRGGSPW